MALFGKKKAAEEAPKNKEKKENSTLDMIKETLEEEKKVSSENITSENELPTEEEIKKAQEILARAKLNGAAVQNDEKDLKTLISEFEKNKTQENVDKVMACLQKPQTLVCVPAQVITSKENEEKMKQGGQVKLDGPVKLNPVLLNDNHGKKVFPIFSGEDTIPDEIKRKTPKVNMPFGHCVNIMKDIKDVDTFVLDPYTANIRIGITINEPNK